MTGASVGEAARVRGQRSSPGWRAALGRKLSVEPGR